MNMVEIQKIIEIIKAVFKEAIPQNLVLQPIPISSNTNE